MNVTSSCSNNELYIRSKVDCHEIPIESGLRINELLGRTNGNSHALSIALEDFDPKGYSPAHDHDEADEYQVILKGRGELTIGNEKKIVTKGDLIKIPRTMNHQTVNLGEKPLKLCCFLTPSWSIQDTNFRPNVSSISEEKIYMRRKEDCDKEKAKVGKGETVYELLGKENGPCEDLSIALVKIKGGCSSEAHRHTDAEECYIITKGQGRLVIDGQTYTVNRDDLVRIPKGKEHQIFNDCQETLKLICTCTPAWTPDCYIKV